MNATPLMTIKQVANALVCSEANVYSLIERGELPFVRIGKRKGYRVDPTDLAEFIQRRKSEVQIRRKRRNRQKLKHIRR